MKCQQQNTRYITRTPCDGPVVEGMTVCLEHATKDALLMLAAGYKVERDRLRALESHIERLQDVIRQSH